MPVESPDLLAGGGIPEPEGPVPAARGEVPAGASAGHRVTNTGVTAERAAVATEGHASEAAVDVSLGEDLLAGRHVADDQVPLLGRLVENVRPRHGGDSRAVGAERHAVERLPGLAKGSQIEVTLAPGV